MKQATAKSGLPYIRDLSGSKGNVAIAIIAVIILVAVFSVLSQMGLFSHIDAQAGYYALQVNPAPDAPQDQQFQNSVFGFDRLALNSNGTFRMGFLKGNWNRSGTSVTLDPTSIPPADQFYSKTSMAQALSILFKQAEFTVSADGKKLTADHPSAYGPVVFTKTNDIVIR